jgi:LPS sulfotransferase NodH
VSWARAEQTGYWQPGDTAESEPHLDIFRIKELVRTVKDHNAVWSTWFVEQRVEPREVVYEDLIDDPAGATVLGVLACLGLVAPPDWRPRSGLGKQADAVNQGWVREYRRGRP